MAQQVANRYETLVKEFWDQVFHQGNIEAADQYALAEVELNLFHKRLTNLKEWKKMARALHEAFPDLHYEFEDFVVEGDRVAFHWEGRGTHKGELWGIAPSNKKLVWHGLTLLHFKNGKVAKGWTYSNFAEVYGSLSV